MLGNQRIDCIKVLFVLARLGRAALAAAVVAAPEEAVVSSVEEEHPAIHPAHIKPASNKATIF